MLQRLKTGQLFEFCLRGRRDPWRGAADDRDRLRAYARDMGLVFQITDDLLDVTSTAEKTGKAVGKDERPGQGDAGFDSWRAAARVSRPKKSQGGQSPSWTNMGRKQANCGLCRCFCSTGNRDAAALNFAQEWVQCASFGALA